MLINASLREYVSKLAAHSAYPGGGSADDLVLTLGIALLQMSLSFSSNKRAYFYQRRLKVLQKKAEILIDKDADNFKTYLRAADKKENIVLLWKVSEETAALSVEVLRVGFRLERFIKDNLVSDLLIGISFALASLDASLANLKINYCLLRKKRYLATLRKYKVLLRNYRKKKETLERRRLNDCGW
ncbi:MAG: cyclodeaminase/cyclohydrolase family protein [Candidatus Omnitrophica bacterium]|nr:cyclodeaminase/cyclohydrolase family protein [Candidatus Omnitrophota bacterium]